MGVEMVHLAEFHGDGHPQDPGRVRLDEMRAMFDECRRLSDQEILFIPGEEANVHLGKALARPGMHPGHWLYLFPKPVFWTMKRASGQPFREDDPEFGPVYHVGNQADMLKLLEQERGPGLDGPCAHQGVKLDAGLLSPRGFLPVGPLAGRGLEGHAGRPLARPPGPARARPV